MSATAAKAALRLPSPAASLFSMTGAGAGAGEACTTGRGVGSLPSCSICFLLGKKQPMYLRRGGSCSTPTRGAAARRAQGRAACRSKGEGCGMRAQEISR